MSRGGLPPGVGVSVPVVDVKVLRLEGDLKEERDAEPGYLLKDVAQLAAGAEELIDLGADALGGGYSS